MFKEDGIALADLIYEKLKNSEDKHLTFDEVIDILEENPNYGLRKIQFYAFDRLYNELNVIRVPEGNYKYGLKLV